MNPEVRLLMIDAVMFNWQYGSKVTYCYCIRDLKNFTYWYLQFIKVHKRELKTLKPFELLSFFKLLPTIYYIHWF